MLINPKYIKSLFFTVIFFFVLGYFMSAGASMASARNTNDPNEYIPFSMAISGGVSLGSYEAGLNWALVNYLKVKRNEIISSEPEKLFPELKSVAGASAGSINALLTAMTWCVDDKKLEEIKKQNPDNNAFKYSSTISDNLFLEIWLNVGIEDLLPDTKDGEGYQKGDGLFTRNAFAHAIERINHILGENIFREDCEIPIGLTVTRVEAMEMSVAGVDVENQRFMIPLRLQSNKGKNGKGGVKVYSHLVNEEDPYLGNVMHMRSTPSDNGLHLVNNQSLFDAILTSSAFPIAFGRKSLEYCSRINTGDENSKYTVCPSGYAPRVDEFLDGGVFDNVPLGTAKALAEPCATDLNRQQLWGCSARRFNYIYLEPDMRRGIASSNQKNNDTVQQQEKKQEGQKEMTFGLISQLQFVGGAITTGRNYELYNVLRGGDWTKQTYQFACKLVNVLDAGREKFKNCTTRLKVDNSTCNEIFSKKIKRQKKLRQTELDQAGACILQDSQALELAYYGFSEKRLSGEAITAMRNKLIRRMHILANTIQKHQLALSIQELKKDKLGDRRILLTKRFAPITGAMLANFGAFLDKPFRQYDYYAGVYDAVYGLADFLCERHADYESCLASQTKEIYQELRVAEDDEANRVFLILAKHEHPDYSKGENPWNWVEKTNSALPDKPGSNPVIIFKALTRNFNTNNNQIYQEPDFVEFITNLFELGYKVDDSSPFIKRVYRLRKKDPLKWYFPLTSKISARLIELEHEEMKYGESELQIGELNSSEIILGAMQFSALALHTYIEDDESKLLIRSAAPQDSWVNWLPYELGLDLRNGGLLVSWLPGIEFSENFSVDLKITPFTFSRIRDEEIYFSQLDLFASYRKGGLLSSFGAGPTYTYTWDNLPGYKQNNLGASVYAGFLQDKFRLTLGQRNFNTDEFAGDSTYLTISVLDIPGFVYWLTK